MNILFLSETGGLFGGVEQNIIHSARALRKRGHRVGMFYLETSERGMEDFEEVFDPFIKLSTPRSEVVLHELLQGAGKGFQCIYVHKWPDSSFVRSLAAVGPDKPRVVRMIHDYDVMCPRRHKYYAWTGTVCDRSAGAVCIADLAFLSRRDGRVAFRSLRPFFMELARQADYDQLIVGSQFVSDQLARNGIKRERILILHPTVPDHRRERSGQPREPGSRGTQTRLLFVGQLIRGKGVDLLLRALKGARDSGTELPAWRLDVVGSGDALSGLTRQAQRLGLSDLVQFHGWQTPGSVAEFYQRADIAVVPSRWPEPFGMVGIEAMRRELPVVGFAVGGIRDWLEDGITGVAVPPGDCAGLGRALANLIRTPEQRRRMGTEGAVRADRMFSFETYIDGLETCLATGHSRDEV